MLVARESTTTTTLVTLQTYLQRRSMLLTNNERLRRLARDAALTAVTAARVRETQRRFCVQPTRRIDKNNETRQNAPLTSARQRPTTLTPSTLECKANKSRVVVELFAFAVMCSRLGSTPKPPASQTSPNDR